MDIAKIFKEVGGGGGGGGGGEELCALKVYPLVYPVYMHME